MRLLITRSFQDASLPSFSISSPESLPKGKESQPKGTVSDRAVHVAFPPVVYEGEEPQHRGLGLHPPPPGAGREPGSPGAEVSRPRAPQAPAAHRGVTGRPQDTRVRGGARDVHPEPDGSSRGWTPPTLSCRPLPQPPSGRPHALSSPD